MHEGRVSEVWRWPVKSMAGERVESTRVDARGAGGDRTHAVLHEHKGEWKPLTAREAPRLLAWCASYPFARDAGLRPDAPPYANVTAPGGEHSYMWDDPRLRTALAGDLDRPVRLHRDVAGIQDLERSLLLTTEATRAALTAELGTELDLRRFRPNLHLELDAPAWAEHAWDGRTVRFEGGVVLRLLHPCVRCAIPTRDPDHAAQVAGAAAPPRRPPRDAVRDQRAGAPGGAHRGRGEAARSASGNRHYRTSTVAPIRPHLLRLEELAVLRIDETSKTLVAPQAGGLVTEGNPDRAELLTLLAASWDAFSAELGHSSLRFVATEPVPGLDILAFDEQAGRAVVVQVTDAVQSDEVGRALAAAAQVASWDAASLSAVHSSLSATVPGDSPQVVLIAGGFDAATIATVDWLARRHGVELSCFGVSFLRFGAERLLTVRREFPPRDANTPDPAAEVQQLLGDVVPSVGVATTDSTPPPGV